MTGIKEPYFILSKFDGKEDNKSLKKLQKLIKYLEIIQKKTKKSKLHSGSDNEYK